MKNKLPFEAYQTDGITLAKRLLGCRLMHRTPEGVCGGIIVETEAYMGLMDDAAHSYRGNPGGRVNIQYGPGGFAYIYLIYGMHSCMNVVANDSQTPEAVLIRALEPCEGLDLMRARRPKAKNDKQLCSGPGKLCAALNITREQYGLDLTGDTLWIEEREAEPAITASPRIGVEYAKECGQNLWRFTITHSPWVSVKPSERSRSK